ncbi:hypothetical protein ACS0TY_021214 [Phlomoides rotata]
MDCPMERLHACFGKHSKVTDLFRPQKVDKKGKPFGFVRFDYDLDKDRLLEDLNNIWIGSYKLQVFIPKYDRKSQEKKGNHPPPSSHHIEVNRGPRIPSLSYVQAVTSTERNIPVTPIPKVDNIIKNKASDEDSKWLLDCLTGLLRNSFPWEDYHEEMQAECGEMLKLKTLGDDVVLIHNIYGKPFTEITKEMDDWFTHWFEWCRPWRPTDVSHKRNIDDDTSQRTRLDRARVQISVSYLKDINQILRLKIDDSEFSIKIVEELDGIPESSLVAYD